MFINNGTVTVSPVGIVISAIQAPLDVLKQLLLSVFSFGLPFPEPEPPPLPPPPPQETTLLTTIVQPVALLISSS